MLLPSHELARDFLRLEELRQKNELRAQNLRILGNQTSTAITAIKLAQKSDQLIYLPKVAAEGTDLSIIKVDG